MRQALQIQTGKSVQLIKKVREYHKENTELREEITRLKGNNGSTERKSSMKKNASISIAAIHHYSDKRTNVKKD